MNTVSILPPKVKEQRKKRKKKIFVTICGSGVLLVLLAIYVILVIAVSLLREELNTLQQQRMMIEQETEAQKSYFDIKNQTVTLENTINEAMDNNIEWDTLLMKLGTETPNGVWFKDLYLCQQGNKVKIAIQGWAQSQQIIAEYINRLETMDQLDDVSCRYYVQAQLGSNNVFQFEIEAMTVEIPQYRFQLEGEG